MRSRRLLGFAPLVLTGVLAAGCTVEQEPAAVPATTNAPAAPTVATPTAPANPPADAGHGEPGHRHTHDEALKQSSPPSLLSSKTAAKLDIPVMIKAADGAFRSNNVISTLRILDEVLQADPQNREALGLMARAAQAQAMTMRRPENSPLYLRSGDAIRKVRDMKVELTPEERALLPVAFYNEACTLVMNGEFPRAIRVLAEAYDAGFSRPELLETDQELEPLRNIPEFQRLRAVVERRSLEVQIAATQPIPFNFRLPDLDGKPVALADVKGEVTIVDIWGTWCVPCRKEIPHLIELAKQYKDKGVRVVGLTYEQGQGDEHIKAIRDFIKEFGVNYPCLIGDGPAMAQLTRFDGYPTTLFLDRDGKLRLQVTGYHSKPTLETAINTMLALGKEPAKPKNGETPPAKAEPAKAPPAVEKPAAKS
ncbi:MAG: TlpA disulfide reductase family protein [Isosphaeraceae bacterium]